MIYLLKRTILTDISTVGELYRDGEFQCYTLEDRDRGLTQDMSEADIAKIKIAHETCIPYGSYPLVITPSERFKREMPQIIGVKGFDGIRIHWGNTAADVEGCVAVGNIAERDFIGESRKAFDTLYPLLVLDVKGGPVEIQIVHHS